MRDIQTYGNYFKSIINLHSTEASMFLMCCSGITRNKQKIVFKSHLDSGTGTAAWERFFHWVGKRGVDGGTEGPERGAEARSGGAPRGVESGEGRRSPSPVWGSGAMPPENFSKIDVKMAYFSAFLQAEMVSSTVVSRQD